MDNLFDQLVNLVWRHSRRNEHLPPHTLDTLDAVDHGIVPGFFQLRMLGPGVTRPQELSCYNVNNCVNYQYVRLSCSPSHGSWLMSKGGAPLQPVSLSHSSYFSDLTISRFFRAAPRIQACPHLTIASPPQQTAVSGHIIHRMRVLGMYSMRNYL